MEKKMARGKAKNRIKKMTFQRQSRTNIIPISKGDKYKDKFYERETDNDENIQRITGGCLRPQYI
tara:strand:+ start:428 stop:622 length:195 start_codon:yes stop_codon:yes gene_type:complete